MGQDLNKYPASSLEDVTNIIGKLFEAAALRLDKRGALEPIGVVLGRIDPETNKRLPEPRAFAVHNEVEPDDITKRYKAAFAESLRALINRFDAVGVITAAVGQAEWKFGEGEGIRWTTRQREALIVTLEHRHFGQEIWVAPIKRRGTRVELGEQQRLEEFVKVDGVETDFDNGRYGGRFFNLLPERWMN